tara:strand:+ start:145 stop:612 length:468 start_codon:yes stop_codon:yes gene_type:complete
MLYYEVNIDFDEAHDAWMQNKKKLPNCTYAYVCGFITKKGTPCQKSQNCKLHKRMKNSKNQKNKIIKPESLLDKEIKQKLELHKYNPEFYNHVKEDLKDINSSKTMEKLNNAKVKVSNFREMYNYTVFGVVNNEQTEFLDLLLKKIEEKKQELEK